MLQSLTGSKYVIYIIRVLLLLFIQGDHLEVYPIQTLASDLYRGASSTIIHRSKAQGGSFYLSGQVKGQNRQFSPYRLPRRD